MRLTCKNTLLPESWHDKSLSSEGSNMCRRPILMPKQHTSSGGSVDFGVASIYITSRSGRHIWRQWQTQMLACGLWLSKSFKPQSGRPLTSLTCSVGDFTAVWLPRALYAKMSLQVKAENPATMPESDHRMSAICITMQRITPPV